MEDENCDRISDLPDDMLTCILSRLPMKDLVATSVLSQRWKDAWLLVPGILFVAWRRFKVKKQVLLSWQMPLAKNSDQRRVQLHRQSPRLPDSINVVSTELIITSCDEKDGKFLTSLKLTYCAIKVIHEQINYFRGLKTLELTCTTFSSDQFRRLISGCSCLESLKIIKCSGFESFGALWVELQTLRFLEVACSVPVVTDPKHVSWSVEQHDAIHFGGHGGTGYGLIRFISGFPYLKRMSLCINTFWKAPICPCVYNSTGSGGFYSLVELNLSMEMKLKTPSEMTLIACLLQNSPILQKLVIKIGTPVCDQNLTSAEDYWQNQKRFACHEHLKEVTINDFSDRVDMSFAKFMLSKSQALRQMKIKFCNLLNDREKLKTRDELISTWKASLHVALILETLGHNSVEASLGRLNVHVVARLHYNL